MKLRISPGAYRFRISGEDLERLLADRLLEITVPTPGTSLGQQQEFACAVRVVSGREVPGIRLIPFRIELVLNEKQLAQLEDPEQEGVYLDTTWSSLEGEHRLRAFIEKDKGCRHGGGRS